MTEVTEKTRRLSELGVELRSLHADGESVLNEHTADRCALYRVERVTEIEILEPGLYEVRDRDGLPSVQLDVREPVERTLLIRALRGRLGPRLVESEGVTGS